MGLLFLLFLRAYLTPHGLSVKYFRIKPLQKISSSLSDKLDSLV